MTKRLYLLLLIAFLTLTQTVTAETSKYLINAGDIMDISVWNEEALQGEYRVLPDGTLSFPLAGSINAAGKTVDEVQKILLENLTKYLSEPAVTVSIKVVEGNAIYVMGQVNKPGNFVMYRPLNVAQALSLAGGLTAFAKANSILILRTEGETQKAINFEYGEIESGDDLASNIQLQSGDVIVVP
jgi:polysaccharide export outer membrane protein